MGFRTRQRSSEETTRRAEHAAAKRALVGDPEPAAKQAKPLRNRGGGYTPDDKVTTQAVLARDRRCLACGATSMLTPSHFVSRRVKEYRHDLRNVGILCVECHMAAEQHVRGFEQWRVPTWAADEWVAAGGVYQIIGRPTADSSQTATTAD